MGLHPTPYGLRSVRTPRGVPLISRPVRRQFAWLTARPGLLVRGSAHVSHDRLGKSLELAVGRIQMSSRQIVINVPEQVLLAEKTDETSFARELAILAAVKLYELGRLSSGRAAELAGMPRVEFLLTLGRYKVFPLEAELRDLETGHAGGH